MKGYDNDEDDREDITASHSSDAESDVEDQEDCDLSQSEEQLFLWWYKMWMICNLLLFF